MKNSLEMGGHSTRFVPTTPISQKHYFFKNGLENLINIENFKIFFCIFIGLFDGILHVLILSVVEEAGTKITGNMYLSLIHI